MAPTYASLEGLGGGVVKSQNFELLRGKHPELSDLGGFAEAYARPDPASALVKLRGFVEESVALVYDAYQLPKPLYTDNIFDLLNEPAFVSAVPAVIASKLHAIRKAGNKGAHRAPVTASLALQSLRDAFDIGQWIYVCLDKGKQADCPVYNEPAALAANDVAAVEREKKAVLERLAAQEAQFKALLAAHEEERKKREAAEQRAARTNEELEELRQAGQKVANVLQLNEETTRRRLIDQDLVAAGWDVGPNGKVTAQVGQEVRLYTMPTPSGEGYADYVLYGDDGKPLAVIEAKRTSKDALVGREQARMYSVCLEKETGQRPLIFYTNGIDIYLWDEAGGYTPRKVYGYPSKDSLDYYMVRRRERRPLSSVDVNLAIADRIYQLEAIKRVGERFEQKARRALLVQATGTGKTRVAIALADQLIRAGWVKRVLFLCDRRELRKQAKNNFDAYLPNAMTVIVGASTAQDRDKRIYLATYPAMMQSYETFDVGFFDLVILDESHRSIYKKYRELVSYFDALQIGLTATPLRYADRDTFKLFGCELNDPTSNYSYDEAVSERPPKLATFRVREFDSKFREEGFRYSQMSEAQRQELEAQESDPQDVDYGPSQVDRDVFNKATSRVILRNLMEDGLRDGTGSRVGKTILFAKNHNHAVHLQGMFDEMYPQYGGKFCRVIDNHEPKAEDLIDQFKAQAEPMIAISVDMLDTGIDVPEVVNLVFAKAVKTPAKFWQMIGRGTRLCANLFGPGKHKTEFLIFDHGKNFKFFEEDYKEATPSVQKSLLQRLFEARLDLAQTAIDKMDETVFQPTVDLLVKDVLDTIDSKGIDVRDKRKELVRLSDRAYVETFDAVAKTELRSIAGPLMQWRNILGNEDAYRFDLLMTRLEDAVLKGSPAVADLKAEVEAEVARLPKNQNPVKAKATSIKAVEDKAFWASVTVAKLDEIRLDLRGLMKFQTEVRRAPVAVRTYDVEEEGTAGVDRTPKLDGLDLVEYRSRVEKVLREHFMNDPALLQIRNRKPVPEAEAERIAKLVLAVDDKANLRHLVQAETKQSLTDVLRGLVGLDEAAVDAAFTSFVHQFPRLSAQQLRFLQLLKHHIAQNGGITVERLYEAPFTTIHSNSVDGVFTEPGQVDAIVAIIVTFQPLNDSPPESKRA
jgi:type I restriction enzyme R subunit